MFKACIIIPIYNHKTTITSTVESLREFQMPCLIIDDGSDDDTKAVLTELEQREAYLTLFHLPFNQGKGAAVMAGIDKAYHLGFTHAIQVDADGQHNLDDFNQMMEEARNNETALISGLPVYDATVPKSRLYGRYLTHSWVWIETLSFNIKDTMCGFRVYPLAKTFEIIQKAKPGKRMDFDIEIMVRLFWENIDVKFVPTKVIYPEGGVSHFKPLKDNILISWMHTKLVFGMFYRLPKILWNKTSPMRRRKNMHWANIEERGNIGGIYLLLFFYKKVGRWISDAILFVVVAYFFLSGRQSRKASREFLQRVYEYSLGKEFQYFKKPPALKDSFAHFMEFGIAARDKILSWLGILTRDVVDIENKEEFYAYLDSGAGGLMLGSHLGNMEASRAFGQSYKKYKMNALVFSKHASKFNKILKKVNPNFDINLIHVNEIGVETAIILREKIQQGEFIAIVGDRTPVASKNRVINVEFLGEMASFSQGPYIIAALLQCPIYLLFCCRQNGRYRVFFEKFADNLDFSRKNRVEHIQLAAQKYAQRLEYYAVRYPLQWFNFFDFWQNDAKARDSFKQQVS